MDGPVLVPVDGSDPANAALEHALDLAADHGFFVHVLYVADTNQPSLTRIGADVVDALELEGEDIVAEARAVADRRSVSITDDIVQGDPREVIPEYAAETGVELVAMGAHGRRGVGEYLLGTTTEHVVNTCEVPVLTVRAAANSSHAYPYEGVLVPTDGSDHAQAAVELGAKVAVDHDATLHLLAVEQLSETVDAETIELPEAVEREHRAVLEKAVETARRVGVDDVVTTVEPGSVRHKIASYPTEEAVDLITMGTHGLSGLDRYLLGSFTDRVIRTAPVPVLTTRASPEDEES